MKLGHSRRQLPEEELSFLLNARFHPWKQFGWRKGVSLRQSATTIVRVSVLLSVLEEVVEGLHTCCLISALYTRPTRSGRTVPYIRIWYPRFVASADADACR